MDERRRKLKFRAWRRGFLEMDKIMGGYADAHLPTMTEEQLFQFEALLSAQDQDVYQWILGLAPVPPQFEPGLIADIAAFALTMTPGPTSPA
jgi:antitoxin CptB